MSRLYHVYLTTESDPTGAVVYWAEHREVPWPAPGVTREAALAKLEFLTDQWLIQCAVEDIPVKPSVSQPLIFDWTHTP